MQLPPEDIRGNIEEIEKLYDSIIGGIRDHNIARFLDFSLKNNLTTWSKFTSSPASRSNKNGHHAFRGGLAYHTLTAAKLAGEIVDHYRSLGMSVNRDLVVCGVILHDIGKIECYKWVKNKDKDVYEYTHTNKSKLHHHIPIGYEWFLRESHLFNMSQSKHFLTQDKIDKIAHMILSHHGRRAWSSPVIPQTTEAYIVHAVEMMDAFVDGYNNGRSRQELYDH